MKLDRGQLIAMGVSAAIGFAIPLPKSPPDPRTKADLLGSLAKQYEEEIKKSRLMPIGTFSSSWFLSSEKECRNPNTPILILMPAAPQTGYNLFVGKSITAGMEALLSWDGTIPSARFLGHYEWNELPTSEQLLGFGLNPDIEIRELYPVILGRLRAATIINLGVRDVIPEEKIQGILHNPNLKEW